MKKRLHVNPALQLLTTAQMKEIQGGDVIDVNEIQADMGEIELPKLPNLPASMPAHIPEYINQWPNKKAFQPERFFYSDIET